ncbi:MAG: molecular chaperone DnaJ [Caulobacteraceae bacterium]|nr:molecular chaperone DnaJ [Caulobacteraceae bacterium]
MSGAAHGMGADEARRALGVDGDADDVAVRRAFRAAVKRHHPDRPGGDEARLRQVIEAYRALRPAAAIAPERRPRTPALTITPADALLGGWRPARMPDGRLIQLHLPAGLREGERLSVDGRVLAVAIAGDAALAVLGDHLCVSVDVPPAFLRQGGRLSIDTPAGPCAFWVSGPDAARGLTRIQGQGLAARAGYRQGDLFVRLLAAWEGAPEPQAPTSQAQDKLRRFAAEWAA